MTITEFAILPLTSDLSNTKLQTLLRTLSEWQSASSGFPLRFYVDAYTTCLHLVTGWASVEAHKAWICGERNQVLRRMFGPHVDVAGVRMVHVDVEFGQIPGNGKLFVERYNAPRLWQAESEDGEGTALIGRDLGQTGDVYRFALLDTGVGEYRPIECWVLERLDLR